MSHGTHAFEAVLFDLDGTLIDSTNCIVRSMELAFAEFGLPAPSRHAIVSRMGIPLEKSVAMIEPTLENSPTCQRVIECYRAHQSALAPRMVTLFDGIQSVLDGLRSQGTPMAIVTSKKSGPATDNLRHLSVLDRFAALVGSDHVTEHKPHPAPALLALERLGLTPSSRVLVVGDSTFDIDMGTRAGLSTCAVLWGAHDEPTLKSSNPTRIVNTPQDLLAVCTGA